VIALIIILVIVVVALAVAAFLVNQKNKQANIARADELRRQAAGRAQTTIAPAQERAADAAAKAEEARVRAERAEAEAREAQVAAHQVEAEHEGQVRAADRLDPRVDHRADDYEPQVAGTVDQQPTPPSEVNADLEASGTDSSDSTHGTDDPDNPPLLPRRTPGAQEMPGKPIATDGGGGWFTRKDETDDTDRA
jgi:FtsZ-interacting cell division protein ZipA